MSKSRHPNGVQHGLLAAIEGTGTGRIVIAGVMSSDKRELGSLWIRKDLEPEPDSYQYHGLRMSLNLGLTHYTFPDGFSLMIRRR